MMKVEPESEVDGELDWHSGEDDDADDHLNDIDSEGTAPTGSPVWQHFGHLTAGKSQCKHCSCEIAHSGGKTSNLFRHLRVAHGITQFDDVKAATAVAAAKQSRRGGDIWLWRPIVWQNFTRQEADKVRCLHCGQLMAFGGKYSNLCRHLRIRHGIWPQPTAAAAQSRGGDGAAGSEPNDAERIADKTKLSPIWEYFTPHSVGRAKCAYCSQVLSYTGTRVSNLFKHLQTRHNQRPQPGDKRSGPVSALAVREAQRRIDERQNAETTTNYQLRAKHDPDSLWHYFDRVDNKRQQCNLCQRHLNCTPPAGLDILIRHLSVEHHLRVNSVKDEDAPSLVAHGDADEEQSIGVSFEVHADETCEMMHTTRTTDAKNTATSIAAGQVHKDSGTRTRQSNLEANSKAKAPAPSNKRKHSSVWEHFSETTDGSTRCSYCDGVFSISGASCSILSRHLLVRHRIPVRSYNEKRMRRSSAPPRNVLSLWAHFERLDPTRLQCRLCLRNFDCGAHQQQTLLKHLSMVHRFTFEIRVDGEVDGDAIVEEHLEQQLDVGTVIALNETVIDVADGWTNLIMETDHSWQDDVVVEELVVETTPHEEPPALRALVKPESSFVDHTADDNALRVCLTGVLAGAKPPPTYEPPFQTRAAVGALTDKYQAIIGRIRAQLQRTDHVALSASLRPLASSSDTSDPPVFLAITAHFITRPDWRMHAVLLNCGTLAGFGSLEQPLDRTQRANITHWLQQACTFWGIRDRVFAICTEDAATEYDDEEESPSIFGTAAKSFSWSQQQCLERRLGEAVAHGLLTKDFEGLRLRFRSLFAELKTDARLAMSFCYFCEQEQVSFEPENIPQFVSDDGNETGDHHWRHTFEDVRRACALQQPMIAALESRSNANGDEVMDYDDDDGRQPTSKLTTAEWIEMRAVRRMLQLYHDALEELRSVGGAASVSTSKAIVLLHCVNRQLDELGRSAFETASTRDTAQNLQFSVMNAIPDVECDLLLAVCTFLDPRFKEHAFEQPNALSNCRLHVEMLMSKLSVSDPETTPATSSNSSSQSSMWSWMEKQRSEQRRKQPSNLEQANREIEFYTEQMALQRGEDPLRWWQGVCEACPRLAQLASKYLALPATCTSSRRVLAATERLLAPEWRLGCRQTAKMVLFVQENMAYFDDEEETQARI